MCALGAGGVPAFVRFGLTQQANGRDRRAWACERQDEVDRPIRLKYGKVI